MNKILEELKANKSPFRHTIVAAVILGIGSVGATLIDLFWVIGDMMIQVHFHHYIVLAGLSVSSVICLISFIWLVKGIATYVNTHETKVAAKKRTKRRISKQSEVIMHLNQRIDELEEKLNNQHK